MLLVLSTVHYTTLPMIGYDPYTVWTLTSKQTVPLFPIFRASGVLHRGKQSLWEQTPP